MDSAADFPPFQEQLQSALVQMLRTSNQLSNEGVNFHRSSSAQVSDSLDEQSGRILSLTTSVLKAATAGTEVKPPSLRNPESIDDNWHGVVDVIDGLLERADACLDEFTGVIKKLSPSQEDRAEQAAKAAAKKPAAKFPTVYDYGPSRIPKPQLGFERAADNTNVAAFRPLLRNKPHAIVPLEEEEE